MRALPTRLCTKPNCSAADQSPTKSSSPAAVAASGSNAPEKAASDHSAKLADVQSHLKDLYSSDVSTEVQHNYTGAASHVKASESTPQAQHSVMQTHTTSDTSDPFAEAGKAAEAKTIE